jgi:hypothetical protein
MSGLGIFIIGNLLSSQVLGHRKIRENLILRRLTACVRYLSYRGYHIKSLGWNSVPVGLLLLGAAGGVYFVCK